MIYDTIKELYDSYDHKHEILKLSAFVGRFKFIKNEIIDQFSFCSVPFI